MRRAAAPRGDWRWPALAAILALVAPVEAVPAAQARAVKAGARVAAKAKVKTKSKAKPQTAATPAFVPVPSPAAAQVIAWIAAAQDNAGLPYAVIDKQQAALFLFDADGTPRGATPVLLGIGVGDESSPGVGAKRLEEIGPAERTTPAGRFVAKFGRAFGNQRVLWVDYANSVALHAVITTHKSEHRVARLLSPTPDDNRISFGCINVGTSFYTKTLRPRFTGKGGIVYILPDTLPLDTVFPRLRLLPYLGAPA
ncbi:hypothetical protein [Sphingomonas kyungheensis]|uniref:L,D-transpeptidase n=1 Tax=Sphingomonas kyungheensis TaxID=1069987 RepID=A0ABU8H4G7_9SPHN